MTREEAIERLIDLGSIIISKNKEDRKYCYAIKLAIKALEAQDGGTTCGTTADTTKDCISPIDPVDLVRDLAERIGIHQLYAITVNLRGEPEPCEDCISRESVLALPRNTEKTLSGEVISQSVDINLIEQLPPVTPKLSKDALDDAYAHGHTAAEAKFYQWRKEHECEDCVARKAVIDLISHSILNLKSKFQKEVLCDEINELPSVTPQLPECEDAVARKDVIKIFHAGYHSKSMVEEVRDLPSVVPKITDNKVHLCDSCKYTYPSCPSCEDDVLFGNGVGNDNICACNQYKPTTLTSKIGKWIKHEWAEEIGGQLIPNYECSQCHEWVREQSCFCPHCGAKVEENNG